MSPQRPTRRDFIKSTGIGIAALAVPGNTAAAQDAAKPAQTTIPRWRGFNLLDFFSPTKPDDNRVGQSATTEDDFRWMSDWGFDFVRFPMAYPRFCNFDQSRPIRKEEVYDISEEALEDVDRILDLCNKYSMHLSLNLHRAPGFCVNAGFQEPYYLWDDQEAIDAFAFFWRMFAGRYKGVSPERISFDLVNEPCEREDLNDQLGAKTRVPGHKYLRVARAAVEAIRAENRDHLIIADGNSKGAEVVPELVELGIAQSCRGYTPGTLTHFQASWSEEGHALTRPPVWPGEMPDGEHWDRAKLAKEYVPWIELAKSGIGVHCGECGCYIKTPHGVFLAWFEDLLDILTREGIGYAIWNFRGAFGILDSGREDVDYAEWHGHRLDKKLLALMTRY